MPGSREEKLEMLTGVALKLRMVLMMPVMLQPESQGSMQLRSSNPFDKPKLDPKYLTAPRDIKVLVEGQKNQTVCMNLTCMNLT